jgi:hypothetical protein
MVEPVNFNNEMFDVMVFRNVDITNHIIKIVLQ